MCSDARAREDIHRDDGEGIVNYVARLLFVVFMNKQADCQLPNGHRVMGAMLRNNRNVGVLRRETTRIYERRVYIVYMVH